MGSSVALSRLLFIALFSASLANTVITEYPLEFITQDHASVHAMTYGFQLLEDVRQIRMVCEERRDELEQQFVIELQNWMKYSQQTQQVMSRSGFDDRYYHEDKQAIEETIASTYKEIYSSRKRRLTVIELQCDESLEELLNQRKLSMLTLTIDLMVHNKEKLTQIVTQLMMYKRKLKNGLVSCTTKQATQYMSRLSSKVLPPEDYCLGPDIKILLAFLDKIFDIIAQEQEQFFGDDEDLGMEPPCAISGCLQQSNTQSHTVSPPVTTENTQPSEKHPHSLSSSGQEIPSTVTPKPPHFKTPQPSYTQPEQERVLVTSDNPENTTTTNKQEASTLSIEADNKESRTTLEPSAETMELNEEQYGIKQTQPTPIDISTAPQVPEWLDDAVNEVLHPQKQNKNAKGDMSDDSGDVYKSKHGRYSEQDHSTSDRHTRVQNIGDQTTQHGSQHNTFGNSDSLSLIYSFITVIFALVVAISVIVIAIFIVKHKRQKLLAPQLQTQDQKIATMKDTGYINPTYKLLNEQDDS